MRPVAVRLAGGLGNQLFQYAAGKATALRLGCPLLLDVSLLEACFEGVTKRHYELGAFRVQGQVVSRLPPGEWREYQQPGYCYDAAFERLALGSCLNGYFQTERFFVSHIPDIRRELQPVATGRSAAFARLAASMDAAEYPVSIHIRRGDYVSNNTVRAVHGLCGPEYYKTAWRIIEALAPVRPTPFLFSDDRNAASDLGLAAALSDTPPDRPWEDLLLMSRCRAHILANSSFSWWGAWLNDKPGKQAVAPRAWFAQETMRTHNTADLHPSGTILV